MGGFRAMVLIAPLNRCHLFSANKKGIEVAVRPVPGFVRSLLALPFASVRLSAFPCGGARRLSPCGVVAVEEVPGTLARLGALHDPTIPESNTASPRCARNSLK